jgi:hypothetical protein
MKLVIPFLGEIVPADQRLLRLAEFLGIECVTFQLDAAAAAASIEFLENAILSKETCFVVNPAVFQKWLSTETAPAALTSFLAAYFPNVLLHSPRPGDFDSSLIDSLSAGHLQTVRGVEQTESYYDVAPNSRDVSEAFSGLRLGPTNTQNDQVFSVSRETSALRIFISIGGQPFMAAVARGASKVWSLGSRDVADIDAEIGDAPITEYFSRLLPLAMALRSIFGEESWRASKHFASVVIDDPLLRKNYGFLNFDSLLTLMKQRRFHSTIAFIPHNFRRSSAEIAEMFRQNAEHLSLCFHGNDHTGAEFASGDIAFLNTSLQVAEHRMEQHAKTTGVHCDRTMVFPQGAFSMEGMATLRAHNFEGAVNTVPRPRNSNARLTLRDVLQPAVLRFESFPLFLRQNSVRTQPAEIAFNCFFGRPVLIVEHHDIFEHPDKLADAATRINNVAPDIRWASLGTVLRNSLLEKRAPDGVHHVQAYSNTVEVSNPSSSEQEFSIEWNRDIYPDQIVKNQIESVSFKTDGNRLKINTILPARSSQTFSLVYKNVLPALVDLGLSRKTKAFARRRLSEFRDNYLSKNAPMLAAAKKIQRSLLR